MGRPDYILGQFGSKVNLFVVTGHSSDDWRNKLVSFARWQQGRGLL